MEHELWSIIFRNQGPTGLRGVGLHTTNVLTPKPKLQTEEDLIEYKRQFLGGLKAAVDAASLAEPQYMIMGMSLEHILSGIDQVRPPMIDIENYSGCVGPLGTMRLTRHSARMGQSGLVS